MERVQPTERRPLEVELLGEQHGCGVADDVDHRVDEARVERPPFERRREVGERLDAVHDVGVALPLDGGVGLVVTVEHIAAEHVALALAIGDELGAPAPRTRR